MDIKILNKIQDKQLKNRPEVKVGDTVKLHLRIKEGNKERVQVFEGLVIAMKGTGINRTVTVRKISSGVGVERVVPMHSPLLDKIEIIQRGTVSKSKMYYMRKRVGKKALRVSNIKDVYFTDTVEEVKAEETTEEVKE